MEFSRVPKVKRMTLKDDLFLFNLISLLLNTIGLLIGLGGDCEPLSHGLHSCINLLRMTEVVGQLLASGP